MDTQLGSTPETEGEWAVDRILSHTGSKTDSFFEIKWKSGDVTWLPYYQITHLQALTDYLDLLGTTQIGNLPKGTGHPPQDDPQVFIGAVTLSSSPIPIPASPFRQTLKSRFQSAAQAISTFFLPPGQNHTRFISPTLDIEASMPANRPPLLRGVNHPRFMRITPTFYSIKSPDHTFTNTIHVGQIGEYLRFDEQLRTRGNANGCRTIPVGYTDFCTAWNNGAPPGDLRRISDVYIAEETGNLVVELSHYPVYLSEFHVTPEQVGVTTGNPNQPSAELQAEINQEFTLLMVERRQRERQHKNERRERKFGAFTAGPYARPIAGPSHTEARPKRRANRKRSRANDVAEPSASASTSSSGTTSMTGNEASSGLQLPAPSDAEPSSPSTSTEAMEVTA